MKRFLEEARKMIRINSITSNGNEELANFVVGLLKDRGLKTQLQQVTHSLEDFSKRQFNVIGILGDPLVDRKIRKGLLLNTHLDTVSPGITENWTEVGGDPFAATTKEGKIYGLGTADVKLDFLCKLHAIEKFREKKLKQPIYLVGTCGEEVGMFGAKYLIKSMALNPRYVVVGEPSELKVVYAHKCFNLLKVSIGYQLIERDVRGFNRRVDLFSFGRSAHSSYPDLGENAILSLLEFLRSAIEAGFELRFTRLEGGETVNKVPDRAMAQFYLTSHQFEDFKRFFRESVQAKSAGKSPPFRVEFGGVGDAGAKFMPDNLFMSVLQIAQLFQSVMLDFKKVRDDTYDPPHSTLNFGRMRQGVGGLDFNFDMRLLPDLVPEEIERHIQKEIQSIAAQYSNLNISAARERMNPGLGMTRDHELVKLCEASLKEANLESALAKKATSTEAAQYFQAGYEAVVFGPGLSQGNSHSPNEFNWLDHLQKATAFYEKLIEKACL